MIDWKKIPKIDAHIHLMPQDVISANIDYDGKFIKYGAVDEYIKIMEENNIEKAFIMPFNDPYMLSLEFNIESVHNNLLEMTKKYEGKLYCFADVDLRREIDYTLSEFDRILNNKSFLGIKLHPSNTGYPIDGEYYDDIFSYAENHDILVEIHSYPREHIRDDVCSPVRIRGIIAKHPKLRVSIAHLGGFQYESLIGMNAYFNLSAILPDMVNRLGISETDRILHLMGADRLIFATDFPDSRALKPTEIYDKYFEILNEMDFTFEEAENICMNNVLKLMKTFLA